MTMSRERIPSLKMLASKSIISISTIASRNLFFRDCPAGLLPPGDHRVWQPRALALGAFFAADGRWGCRHDRALSCLAAGPTNPASAYKCWRRVVQREAEGCVKGIH